METKLSVVIVEYRSIPEIRECVEALKRHLDVPYEIIVSSNSCYSEEERQQADTGEEHVRWLFNDRNGGFAYAMNLGLKVAKGKYLAIMNSDDIFNSDISGMTDFMDAHPDVGAIAPQMRDKEGTIQDTARPYVSLPRYVWRQMKRIAGRKSSILDGKFDYSLVQTVDWVIGAFIMVSRKAYEATGGLDERYFMYAEDLDWCTRIRQQGLEIVYFPKICITYKGSRRARSSSKYARIFIASHIKYWKKFGFLWGYPKRKELTFNS